MRKNRKKPKKVWVRCSICGEKFAVEVERNRNTIPARKCNFCIKNNVEEEWDGADEFNDFIPVEEDNGWDLDVMKDHYGIVIYRGDGYAPANEAWDDFIDPDEEYYRDYQEEVEQESYLEWYEEINKVYQAG